MVINVRLNELEPHWVGAGGEGIWDKDMKPVPERHGVGISFICPCGCGTRLAIMFTNPLDGGEAIGDRTTWQRTGETFDNLTLAPSILRVGGCAWHGFITCGEIIGA